MSMRKYKDDYEMVATQDESGQETLRPVYRGGYFEVSLEEEGLFNLRRSSLLLLVPILVLQIGAGFLNNGGMYQFYISLPYVFSFLALFYLGWGILRIPKENRLYRREEVDLSFNRIKSAGRNLLGLLAIGILGEIVFLSFFSDGVDLVLEFVFLLLEVMAAIVVYFQIRLLQPISVQAKSEQSEVD